MDDIISEFLAETAESMTEIDNLLLSLEHAPDDAALIGTIFRTIHTIKGTCGFLGLPRLEQIAHKSEDMLGLFRNGSLKPNNGNISALLVAMDIIKNILQILETTGAEPAGDDSDCIQKLQNLIDGIDAADDGHIIPDYAADFDTPHLEPIETSKKTSAQDHPAEESTIGAQSLRVTVDVLENLMTMVSELVLTRNQLLQINRQHRIGVYESPLQRLNLVVSDLQEGVMKTRMQPVGNAWQKLPRIVRDICNELNKKIDLEMHGQNTELDRQILDMIKDPLTHMIRNSADHGIESTEARIAAGKPMNGKIVLRSYHQGGHIMIELSDDGRGLSTERIRSKILENGLISASEIDNLTVQQLHQYIFHPGFSTATTVTAVSGRGVGMDVVRSNIEKIGGFIEMRTVEGKGTHFTIKIPLTLAIVSALIIGTGNERFAIPQLSVSELVLVSPKSSNRIEYINNSKVMRLRGNLLPLIDLEELMGLEPSESKAEERFIIVTNLAQFMFGIIVDKVYDLEEIVVKPVTKLLRDLPIFSGNTILGDGRVITILDPTGILKMSGISDSADMMKQVEDEKVEQEGDDLPFLLFQSGEMPHKAAPLHLVSRLEKIDIKDLEMSDKRHVIQYQGMLMPVVATDTMPTTGTHPLIILQKEERIVGLVVDKIVDISNYRGKIQAAQSANISGSIVLNSQATDIIDVGWYTNSGILSPQGTATHYEVAAE